MIALAEEGGRFVRIKSMRPFVRFWVFFLVCVLLAAGLSPWIYLGIRWSAATLHWSWLNYLAGHPFHRYFNRVLQVSLLIGVWRSLKRTGFNSFRALGFRAKDPFYLIFLGLGSSLLFFGGYGIMLFGLGWQRMSQEMPRDWVWFGSKIFLTAVMVSFFEEAFFRGYFYRLCQREIGHLRALGLNALFFSVVHYIKPPKLEDLKTVDWSSGFQMLGIAFQQFSNPLEIVGGILVLMWVARILCWTLDRTSNLYLAIGLHTGWIVTLQWNSELMHETTGWSTWVLGGGNLSQGVMALLPLTLQFLTIRWWLKRFRISEYGIWNMERGR